MQTCRHFIKVQTLYALTSHALTFKAGISKRCMFCCLLNNVEASLTNSVDAYQTAPVGAINIAILQIVTSFMSPPSGTGFYLMR